MKLLWHQQFMHGGEHVSVLHINALNFRPHMGVVRFTPCCTHCGEKWRVDCLGYRRKHHVQCIFMPEAGQCVTLTQPVRHYSVLACSRYAFCVTVHTFLGMPDHVTLGLEFADLFGGTVSGNMTR